MQGRPAVRHRRAHVGAMREQQRNDVGGAVLRSQDQRSEPRGITRLEIGAFREQALERREIAGHNRLRERGDARSLARARRDQRERDREKRGARATQRGTASALRRHAGPHERAAPVPGRRGP